MHYPRKLDLARDLEKRSVLLLGPRRTGKSALIRHALSPDRTYDLLQADTFQALSARPSLIREALRPQDRLVAIDEIQKLPALMDEVHGLIESTSTHFLLTGSSARKLRRSGTSLMGGRARTRRLFPFVAEEVGLETFDLDRALSTGLLPPIWLSDEPWDDLADYVGTYLQEEIRAEGLARNIEAFSRFVRRAALSHGELLNFESVGRDAQVPARTVREYYDVLTDTYLGHLIEPLRTPARKAVSHGRFYFFDNGVVNRLVGRRSLMPGTPEYGTAFEAYIAHELLAWLSYTRRDEPLNFWRTHDQVEVDFVLGGHTALEVKSSALVTERDAAHLHRLGAVTPLRRKLIVSRDPHPRRLGDVEVLPWRDFVGALWAGTLLEG
jgi:predicted AAA+ superfamily ATPase